MLAAALKRRIGAEWEGTTPGFHLCVLREGRVEAELRLGVTYPTYDWASLTKMVFTLTLFLECVDRGQVHEDDPVGRYLPELSHRRDLLLRHLLSHTAGLPGTIGFWNRRPEDPSAVRAEWRRQVLSLPMAPSARSSYSEIDFQILGYVLESLLGADLEAHWVALARRLGLTQTHFRPLRQHQSGSHQIAPTEVCPLRGMRIQGQVHHPDVWLDGGVGWLAGLFGPMEDLVAWAQGLRRAYFGLAPAWVVGQPTLRRFAARATAPHGGSSALGFMMPKLGRRDGQRYYLSCGHRFGPESIGHTGFTGPMFWFDPAQDLFVLVLANRTFPNAANESWFDFRGVLHDRVVESLEEGRR